MIGVVASSACVRVSQLKALNALPFGSERSGRASGYCLSYTAVLVNFLPFESVPLTVTVRLLPSADTATRRLAVTLPPFLTLNPSVWSSIFVYDRMSEFGLPVTG